MLAKHAQALSSIPNTATNTSNQRAERLAYISDLDRAVALLSTVFQLGVEFESLFMGGDPMIAHRDILRTSSQALRTSSPTAVSSPVHPWT